MKEYLTISTFTEFQYVWSHIYNIMSFHKLLKIQRMYSLAGRLAGQPYISLLFLQLLKAHNIVNMWPNILKLGKYTTFDVLFLMTESLFKLL